MIKIENTSETEGDLRETENLEVDREQIETLGAEGNENKQESVEEDNEKGPSWIT